MNVWPSSVTYFAEPGSFNLQPNEPQLRSDYEYGPARTRRRFRGSVPKIEFSIVMTSEEFEVFKSFYSSSLNFGTSWFKMPVFTGSDYEELTVRFTEFYQASDAGFMRMKISVRLEARGLTMLDEGSIWLIGEYGEEFVITGLHDPLEIIVNTDWPSVTETI